MARWKHLALLTLLIWGIVTLLAIVIVWNNTRRSSLTVLPTLALLPKPSSVASPTISPIPTRFIETATPSFTLPAVTATLTPHYSTPEPTLRMATQTATATLTPTSVLTACPNADELNINFEGIYSLMLELRKPVRETLRTNRSKLPPCSQWIVSAYRDQGVWAKITLIPEILVDNGWQRVEEFGAYFLEVVAFKSSTGIWQAALVNGIDFAAIAPRIPASFMDVTGTMPPLAGAYLFPWRSGEAWWSIAGWHDGNALDFQPTPGSHYSVLASESGILKEICSDGTQSLLQIRHADGISTYYLHVRLSLSVRRALLDRVVEPGQYLGELINRAHFLTPCGRGSSRHLHFVVSDRMMLLDEIPINQIAETATCCTDPPRYISSNMRIDAQPQ